MKVDMGFQSSNKFAGILLMSGVPASLFGGSYEDVQSHE
jgi:hypothetical protein